MAEPALPGPRIAYIVNTFPTSAEYYVVREVEALRARGVEVTVFATRRPAAENIPAEGRHHLARCEFLAPLRPLLLARAVWVTLVRAPSLIPVFRRILWGGREGLGQRARAIVHVVLGVYFALRLRPHGVAYVHAHHGYFAAWAAMIAWHIDAVPFGVTFHGSDVLVDRLFLDLKALPARTLVTVSRYNKRALQDAIPGLDPERIVVCHPGIRISDAEHGKRKAGGVLVMINVGRLHPVKDQRFLVRACRLLKDRGVIFLCLIAGAGREQSRLTALIRSLDLEAEVKLLGQIDPLALPRLYGMADVFVLTSRSEGLPLVVLEAMFHGVRVIAPAITGIPEIVGDDQHGTLYRPGDLEGLVNALQGVRQALHDREEMIATARDTVRTHFDSARNSERVADLLIGIAGGGPTSGRGFPE